ncbi:hypothetical protein [Saprospira grandis]|uniref:Uncharacterized protein n=1 Tax=Saprospira grandis (strain Lewin) TaxID=984262 RepID=H6L9G3_SAPGL|nr:hypothetical protein SGRA_2711 [Saprospira grandis str. Lewin]
MGQLGGEAAPAEGWKRVAEGQTQLFEQSEKSAGPSRPASPDTARPARRAGQPQKNIKKKKRT